MKKLILLAILIISLLCSCETHISGTIKGVWTDIENNKWAFGDNHILTYENGKSNFVNYPFTINNGKLTIQIDKGQSYDISISPDKRVLFLSGGKDFDAWRVAGPGLHFNRLTKRADSYRIDKTTKVSWSASNLRGNWTDIENRKWSFSSNDVLFYENRKDDIRSYNYSTNGGTLTFQISGSLQSYNLAFSSDGKTVTLTGGKNITGWRNAGPGWYQNTLTR